MIQLLKDWVAYWVAAIVSVLHISPNKPSDESTR